MILNCHICGGKLKKTGIRNDFLGNKNYQKYQCCECGCRSETRCRIENGKLVPYTMGELKKLEEGKL